MTRYGTLRTWAAILKLAGFLMVVLTLFGVVVWAFEVDGLLADGRRHLHRSACGDLRLDVGDRAWAGAGSNCGHRRRGTSELSHEPFRGVGPARLTAGVSCSGHAAADFSRRVSLVARSRRRLDPRCRQEDFYMPCRSVDAVKQRSSELTGEMMGNVGVVERYWLNQTLRGLGNGPAVLAMQKVEGSSCRSPWNWMRFSGCSEPRRSALRRCGSGARTRSRPAST